MTYESVSANRKGIIYFARCECMSMLITDGRHSSPEISCNAEDKFNEYPLPGIFANISATDAIGTSSDYSAFHLRHNNLPINCSLVWHITHRQFVENNYCTSPIMLITKALKRVAFEKYAQRNHLFMHSPWLSSRNHPLPHRIM